MSEFKSEFEEALQALNARAYLPWGHFRESIFDMARLAAVVSCPGQGPPPTLSWEKREEATKIARKLAFDSLKAWGYQLGDVTVDREAFEVDRQLWRILVQTKAGVEEMEFPWEGGYAGLQPSINYMAYMKEDAMEDAMECVLGRSVEDLAQASIAEPVGNTKTGQDRPKTARVQAMSQSTNIKRKKMMAEQSFHQFEVIMTFDELAPYELGVEKELVALLPVDEEGMKQIRNLLPLTLNISKPEMEVIKSNSMMCVIGEAITVRCREVCHRILL